MKTYNFPDMVRGDTFKDRTIKFTINEVEIDWTASENKAAIQFRRGDPNGKVYKQLTLENGLAANDPDLGWIKIQKFSTDKWPAGTYYYDVELDIDGKISTYIGGTMKLIQDTTRKTT